MIKHIIAFTLDGCDVCKKLKTLLNKSSISFLEKKCELFSNECDSIEYMINCEYYPIVQLQTTDDKNIFLAIANDYNTLNKKIVIDDKNYVIYLQSVDSIFESIKKIY